MDTDEPIGAATEPEVQPQLVSHVQMLMWFHNMYINMMHRRCYVESQRQN